MCASIVLEKLWMLFSVCVRKFLFSLVGYGTANEVVCIISGYCAVHTVLIRILLFSNIYCIMIHCLHASISSRNVATCHKIFIVQYSYRIVFLRFVCCSSLLRSLNLLYRSSDGRQPNNATIFDEQCNWCHGILIARHCICSIKMKETINTYLTQRSADYRYHPMHIHFVWLLPKNRKKSVLNIACRCNVSSLQKAYMINVKTLNCARTHPYRMY